MEQKTEFIIDRENLTITATRVFDAPRGMVWAAVTDSTLIPLWWGPRRFTTAVEKNDLRPGGEWRFVQHGADGKKFGFHGITKEVVLLERITQTFNFEGIPDGHEMIQTMTLADSEGGTTTLTQTAHYQNIGDLEGMAQAGMEKGLEESMDRLAELTSPKREATITRIFDAPRKQVFKAWTDPNIMAQWWGPAMFTIPVCELDPRAGGAIRIHMKGPDGGIYPMTGTFEEVKEPEHIVFASYAFFENGESNPKLKNRNTITFEEQGGKTKLTIHIVVLEGGPELKAPLSGMEMGWRQSLEKLAEHLQ